MGMGMGGGRRWNGWDFWLISFAISSCVIPEDVKPVGFQNKKCLISRRPSFDHDLRKLHGNHCRQLSRVAHEYSFYIYRAKPTCCTFYHPDIIYRTSII